ncbi:DNA polymerase I [Halorubrum alkaliphilum]|uniref:DNA polymerase n=1 Tax=Halorubrum alkaliphilum TaxID=261290 RepID=A0A8T4GHP1_9EURY|nr:DNA polymerase domain-containing protein [Halorubrum alkaliphilum]MBP1923150.1 DNA polymerase I [Halorubrum alkaliphilum]
MTQSGLTDFSSSENADDGGGTGRDDLAAAEAEVVTGAGGGRVSNVIDVDEAKFPNSTGTVELMITQIDYAIEGYGSDEYPVVHVFGRRPNGGNRDDTGDSDRDTVEHLRVLGVEPYFYVPTTDLDIDPVEEYDVVIGTRETDPNGDPYESIRGEPLTRIVTRTPRDVGSIRDDFTTTFEADILFPNRFLIDNGLNGGIRVEERRLDDEDGTIQVHERHLEPADVDAEMRVNTFDIEVDDRRGFPEDGEEPIICLTSHDSYDDEYVIWLYDAPDAEVPPPEELPDYEGIVGDGDELDFEVRTFEEEAAMLDAFVEYISETDPDLFTGWNCLPADSQILKADGTVQRIEDVCVGDEVIGSDEQRTTTAEVTNKWESEKDILRYRLADGTDLRSSEDHRVMVGDDDQVDWKEGSEIDVGDYLLKPRKLNVDSERVPTLSDLVPIECQRFGSKEAIKSFKSELPYGAVSELAEEFDLATGTLHHPKTDVWTPERCQLASDRYDVALPDGGREYRRTRNDLDRELTGHKMYLAGLVLTDGTMSPEDGVRFYNTREELHEQFPGETHLEPDGKGCYKQNVLDYARMYAFNGLGIPFGDKNEGEVDLSTVFELPESHIERFLAGVIDGDGNVSSSVTVAAENRSIGEWYVKLFRRLGIYAEQRENVVRVPDAEREIQRLRDRVLPHLSHSKRREAIKALDGGKSGRSENIPYALFEADTGTDEKRIGRDKHRRRINLKRHETTLDKWPEYVFVEVEDVERVGTETTYDIETTTHNFFADDCLVHNCEDFDVPYFFDRMEELDPGSEYNLSVDRFSRIGEVWRSGWGGPDVKGRVVFDLLYAYKRTMFTELESYRLDAVGERELGVGKERYAGDIGDLWEQDPERLLEYSIRDVELCVEIDRAQDVIAFWDDARKIVGCKIEDATTPGDAVDMYVLHMAYGNFALPSKGQQEAEEFEGGAVFDPISGVREMVSVLDLKSLYPMSMVTINASPETKVDPETYDGETYKTPTGVHFRKEPDGIIREMVNELLDEREEKKALRNEHDPGTEAYEQYDRQQGAVKVLMNSLYGVFGWDRFRLYDREMSAGVTSTNREVIDFTADVTSELNREVTYGDTDSVMLSLGDLSKEEAIESSFEIENHINERYDDFAREELNAEDHRFQIEFEKLYRRFFQAGKKKRYAGHIIWKEGTDVDDIDITGFEYKRSDIAGITKEVQQHVIETIVTGDNIDEDMAEITTYLSNVIDDFLAGNLDVEEVGIPGGIGKRLDAYETPTAQVRGAQYANEMLGTNFGSGSKPKRLYLKKVHPDFWDRMEEERGLDPQRGGLYGEFKRDPDVICFEYADQIPEEFEIDWEKMLNKTLKGPIERVIEALGTSWEEVKTGQEQTGLGSFM